jgi:hypothetical protein
MKMLSIWVKWLCFQTNTLTTGDSGIPRKLERRSASAFEVMKPDSEQYVLQCPI